MHNNSAYARPNKLQTRRSTKMSIDCYFSVSANCSITTSASLCQLALLSGLPQPVPSTTDIRLIGASQSSSLQQSHNNRCSSKLAQCFFHLRWMQSMVQPLEYQLMIG